MRGEKEKKCLEIVKTDFMNNYPSSFFGLNYEEVEELNQILNETKANEEISKFPDFIFDNGFIEHFQITSSKENKKGSLHIKDLNNFKDKVKKEKLKIQFDNNQKSKHLVMKYPEHSYEYLVKSFKKNWNSHLESFQKYKGKKDISIFMIQYSDMALEMYENIYENWIDGMSNGDLREPERLDCYRITRDKEILEYLLTKQVDRKVEIKSPQKGEKLRLIEMAEKNAKVTLENKEKDKYSILNELKQVLKLESMPRKIECYDISNLSGTFVVAGMCVMQDGIIKKNLSRRFKIKTVIGQDDPRCMKEVIR